MVSAPLRTHTTLKTSPILFCVFIRQTQWGLARGSLGGVLGSVTVAAGAALPRRAEGIVFVVGMTASVVPQLSRTLNPQSLTWYTRPRSPPLICKCGGRPRLQMREE